VVILAWSLIPIYWAVNISLTNAAGLQGDVASFLPNPLSFDNYLKLLSPGATLSGAFYVALRNSVIEAGFATVLTVFVALLGGYAFARWRFAGSRTLFLIIVATLSLPLLAVLIPLFKWTAQLGLLDTYPPIVLLAVSASLPLALWIMRSFVASLPVDIESAARLDGASELRVLWHIVLPLLGPAVAAVGIIVFLSAWSAFLVPVFFSSSTNTQPLTVFIPNLVTKQAANLGPQAAAACLSMAFPILVVVLLHRYLISGLIRGASR
jgi:multiple sugar transport system permease protein